DANVEQVSGNAAAGRAAGLHSLEFVAVGDATADPFDDLAQADAHRDFDQACVCNFSGEPKNLGALAAFRADTGKPLAALADDGRNVGKGFNVVDQGRLAPQTAGSRVGRPGFGCAALAFNGCDERRLFAADKRTCSKTNLNIEVERSVANVVAEQTVTPCFTQCRGEP